MEVGRANLYNRVLAIPLTVVGWVLDSPGRLNSGPASGRYVLAWLRSLADSVDVSQGGLCPPSRLNSAPADSLQGSFCQRPPLT